MKIKKRILEKKTHFFFGEGEILKAKILFFRRHSNFFITLLDMNDKVVCSKTSGCHSFCLNKKRKTSFQAIECIISLLFPFLKLYAVTSIVLIFRALEINICQRLISCFQLYNDIKVCGVFFLMKNPHNGVRGRCLRRV